MRLVEASNPSGEAAELTGSVRDLERVAAGAAELEAAAKERLGVVHPSLVGADAGDVERCDRCVHLVADSHERAACAVGIRDRLLPAASEIRTAAHDVQRPGEPVERAEPLVDLDRA